MGILNPFHNFSNQGDVQGEAQQKTTTRVTSIVKYKQIYYINFINRLQQELFFEKKK
jgi:hypothetical protein